MEKIFEEISKELDGGLPSGGDWHQKLLVQMASEIPTRRPAVIRRATRDCLEEYRRFRHTVRSIYTFNLRPARLQDLTTELRSCYNGLCEDIDIFCQFLLALSNASNSRWVRIPAVAFSKSVFENYCSPPCSPPRSKIARKSMRRRTSMSRFEYSGSTVFTSGKNGT